MHTDLFSAGHSTDEVYQALGEHQIRDHRTLRFLDLATALALIGALTNFNGWGTGLWVAAAFLGLSSTRYFIDTSNRNFFMHRLDWEAADTEERERR